MKSFIELKEAHDKLRIGLSDNFNIRMHRSLSWLKKAELEKDPDAIFIFLWISFNSAYSAQDNKDDSKIRSDFLILLYRFGKKEIDKIIVENFQNEIYEILDNEYLMNSYWDGPAYEFQREKEINKQRAQNALFLSEKNSKVTLDILFRRMNVLRNQIFHGYTTQNSSYNRKSVEDSSELMLRFIPLFIEIMINNPSIEWGEIDFHPDGINK